MCLDSAFQERYGAAAATRAPNFIYVPCCKYREIVLALGANVATKPRKRWRRLPLLMSSTPSEWWNKNAPIGEF